MGWGEHRPQLALIRTAKPFTTHVVNNQFSWCDQHRNNPPPVLASASFAWAFQALGLLIFHVFLILISGERLACAVSHAFILVVLVRETCCVLLSSGKSSQGWGFYQLLCFVLSLISSFYLVPFTPWENFSLQQCPDPTFPSALPLSWFSLIWLVMLFTSEAGLHPNLSRWRDCYQSLPLSRRRFRKKQKGVSRSPLLRWFCRSNLL